jgi:farnesyl-diphosphate farnesyltransferase
MTLLKRIGISWGLQAVNIISNREEDLSRGVDFLLKARRNLVLADAYMESIKPSPILDFCKIPLTLAQATIDALSVGETKLSRTAITELVRRTTGE